MSNQITLVIAEDEAPLSRDFAKQLRATWPAARLVASCSDGASAISAVEKYNPDVVFLDIRMPKISGLEVAKKIGERAFIVFTTAYDEYAVSAFESGAVDYLLKPIEPKRLIETIARLETRINSQQPQNLEALINELQAKLSPQQEYIKWVTANTGNTMRMISVDDVIYFQADQKYTKVVTTEFEAIIRTPLKELTSRLDNDKFWHVHRSAIVAVNAIDTIKKDELGHWHLRLKAQTHRNEHLPVSVEFQRRMKAF